MNIAITAAPTIPVPPNFYGGIERIIGLLIDEYVKAGHQVTLFAHRDSLVPCELIGYRQTSLGRGSEIANMVLITKTVLSRKFDIIHSFGRLGYLIPLLPLKVPKLMSYQREPTLPQIQRAVLLARSGSLSFTGCSNYITDQIDPIADVSTVYNAVDMDKYQFLSSVAEDAPLVFLGRIEPIKGTHIAIEIAENTGRKLVIAGNIPGSEQSYFDEKIKPFLGPRVDYIGPVDDRQKAALLGKAAALLMPITWNEPFGIVMIEAMACGTPVLGFGRGSVPEVVQHGVTGFVAGNTEALNGFVARLSELDRGIIRRETAKRFSAPVIAEQYLQIYGFKQFKKKYQGKS